MQKPLKFLLRLIASVVTIRELAELLRVTLEAHAEHEHIAPGWLGKPFHNFLLSSPLADNKIHPAWQQGRQPCLLHAARVEGY